MTDALQSNQGVKSRVAAAHLLAHVLGQRQTIDDALERVATKYRLSDDDRRLVHAIAGIVFRSLPAIDAILRRVMDRTRDPSPALLHQLLRVGVAQLLWMDVPAHAAVHTCVSAAGSLNLGRQKSLVNAVLRSVQRQDQSLRASLGPALEMLPQWLRERWVRHYGQDAAGRIAAAVACQAPLDLSIKDAQASLQWAQDLGADTLIPGSVRVRQSAGHITSWPGFQDGAWWVQDLAASLSIRMLGDVSGKSVLDVCAAPGGKSLQLAALGAKVTALDIAPARMTRLQENARRVRLEERIESVVADAASWQTGLRFDAIVLDAPCTSTGTLRRHPELPWIHEEKDVSRMAVHQHDLLRRAADLLRDGAYLLYCTCSMEVEEGEDQVESFLKERPDFSEVTQIPAVVQPFLKRGVRNIGFRTYPDLLADRGGMDGFFMACMKKI